MKMPVVSGREVIRALTREGFSIVRTKGSHVHLTKETPEKTFHVTVPVHANRDLNPFVLRSIARQSGYSFEEFATLF